MWCSKGRLACSLLAASLKISGRMASRTMRAAGPSALLLSATTPAGTMCGPRSGEYRARQARRTKQTDGHGTDVDDGNTRARGPAPSPRSSASAEGARGDRTCHAARTARSWRPRAGRESGSPGSTRPHARCRSYGTGRRRLSLGSRPSNRCRRVCRRSNLKTPGLLRSRDVSLL
jgi:hypothetical protein